MCEIQIFDREMAFFNSSQLKLNDTASGQHFYGRRSRSSFENEILYQEWVLMSIPSVTMNQTTIEYSMNWAYSADANKEIDSEENGNRDKFENVNSASNSKKYDNELLKLVNERG